MRKMFSILAPALLITTLSGCTSLYRYHETRDSDLVDVSYDAVSTLQDKLATPLPKGSLIIVSTLLNVDNKNQTSSFGRIISDQVASALHDSGHQIIGIELPIDLFTMEEGGQLHLTPETRQILKRYNANVIVGGVYAPGKKNAYISLRMIDLTNRTFISSAEYSVPMGPDAKALLQPKTVGSAEIAPNSAEASSSASTPGEPTLIDPTPTEDPSSPTLPQ